MSTLVLCAITGFISFGAGSVLTAIGADRSHKHEEMRLHQQLADQNEVSLSAVGSLEQELEEKNKQISEKQRVLDSLNEEVARLRRINAKMRRKENEE